MTTVGGVGSGGGGGDYDTQGATEAPVTDGEASAPATESEGATATESENATNAAGSYASLEEATGAAQSGRSDDEIVTRNADGSYGTQSAGSGPESGGAGDIDPSHSDDQRSRALQEATDAANRDRAGGEVVIRNPDGSYSTTQAP